VHPAGEGGVVDLAPVRACDACVTAAEEFPHVIDHVARSRAFWEGLTPEVGTYGDQVGHGRQRWAEPAPVWGDWNVPESELRLLPDDVAGMDVLELGCGTGYVSAWLARLGARPVGVDLATRQLRIARALQEEHDLSFPLLQANAERPPLADRRFDLLISEYGLIACDPRRWVPEAARLLRPGGRLVVLSSTPLSSLCTPTAGTAGDRLVRDYFGMSALHLIDDRALEFQLPHGEGIRLLRDNGFVVDDLVEIQAPEDAQSPWPFVPLDWARRWPSEEVWKATQRG
jgi:SAM-dependent methyltransferase